MGPSPSATTVAWKPDGRVKPSGSAAKTGAAARHKAETSNVFFMHSPDGGGWPPFFRAHARGPAPPAPGAIAQAFDPSRAGAELALAMDAKKQPRTDLDFQVHNQQRGVPGGGDTSHV